MLWPDGVTHTDGLQRALIGTPWQEFEAPAPDGRPYWYNAETKQTTWEMPAVVKSNLDSGRAKHQPPPMAPTPSAQYERDLIVCMSISLTVVQTFLLGCWTFVIQAFLRPAFARR